MDPVTKFALVTPALSAVVGTGLAFFVRWRKDRRREHVSDAACAIGIW